MLRKRKRGVDAAAAAEETETEAIGIYEVYGDGTRAAATSLSSVTTRVDRVVTRSQHHRSLVAKSVRLNVSSPPEVVPTGAASNGIKVKKKKKKQNKEAHTDGKNGSRAGSPAGGRSKEAQRKKKPNSRGRNTSGPPRPELFRRHVGHAVIQQMITYLTFAELCTLSNCSTHWNTLFLAADNAENHVCAIWAIETARRVIMRYGSAKLIREFDLWSALQHAGGILSGSVLLWAWTHESSPEFDREKMHCGSDCGDYDLFVSVESLDAKTLQTSLDERLHVCQDEQIPDMKYGRGELHGDRRLIFPANVCPTRENIRNHPRAWRVYSYDNNPMYPYHTIPGLRFRRRYYMGSNQIAIEVVYVDLEQFYRVHFPKNISTSMASTLPKTTRRSTTNTTSTTTRSKPQTPMSTTMASTSAATKRPTSMIQKDLAEYVGSTFDFEFLMNAIDGFHLRRFAFRAMRSKSTVPNRPVWDWAAEHIRSPTKFDRAHFHPHSSMPIEPKKRRKQNTEEKEGGESKQQKTFEYTGRRTRALCYAPDGTAHPIPKRRDLNFHRIKKYRDRGYQIRLLPEEEDEYYHDHNESVIGRDMPETEE